MFLTPIALNNYGTGTAPELQLTEVFLFFLFYNGLVVSHSDFQEIGTEEYKTDPIFKEAFWCLLVHGPTGCILPVRFQGDCDCCYAFAVVDVTFSSHFLAYGAAVKGSEQELLDNLDNVYPSDSGDLVTNHCLGEGNSFRNTFNYVVEQGLALESDWPFKGYVTTAVDDLKQFESKRNSMKRIYLCSFHTLPDGCHDEVQEMLHIRPLTTRVVCYPSFLRWDYKTGVYGGPTEEELVTERDSRNEGRPSFDGHSLVLVGYGIDRAGIRYYIAKNSYSESWGYKGYIWIAQQICTHFYYAGTYKLLTKTERDDYKREEEEYKNWGKEAEIARKKKMD